MTKLIAKAIATSSKDILQATLEDLFNKNQLIPKLRREMEQVPRFLNIIKDNRINKPFAIDLLVQMAIHRRCKINILVGLLRPHFKDTQLTANEILKCAEADLVDFDPNFGLLVTVCQITAELQADIDKYQYPLPLVKAPLELKTNSDTGYHVFRKGSVILRNNHHEDDVCLDHLNRCNQVRMVINSGVMSMIQNKWRNLDKPKQDESVTDYQKRVKAFEKYDRTSREVMKLVLSEGNSFYLSHKYDKRGRTYCQGYQMTYQGAPWNKAVVEFANKEII